VLTIVSDCQYTLLGLTCLLTPFHPVPLTRAQLQRETIHPDMSVLVAASSRDTLAGLLPVFRKARWSAGGRLALLGTSGQSVFLNSLGFPPDVVLSVKTPAAELCLAVDAWLSGLSGQVWLHTYLSNRERSVLQSTLAGETVHQFCQQYGISPKTFYTHRRLALRRLGMGSVQRLLANPETGLPDPARHYIHLLQNGGRKV
jgi:DNA-binding CsgD family transcriptional regulator